jgi:hypothetical protein
MVAAGNHFTAETDAAFYGALYTTVRNLQFDPLCLRRVSFFVPSDIAGH